VTQESMQDFECGCKRALAVLSAFLGTRGHQLCDSKHSILLRSLTGAKPPFETVRVLEGPPSCSTPRGPPAHSRPLCNPLTSRALRKSSIALCDIRIQTAFRLS